MSTKLGTNIQMESNAPLPAGIKASPSTPEPG